MQSPSCSPSPISVGATASYYAAQVLCDTNRTTVDLADLYHQQQQLTIHSAPPRTQPLARVSSNSSFNVSNKSPDERPIPLPSHFAPTPAPLALSPRTIQTMLQTQPDLNAMLLHSIANGLLQTITNREADTAVAIKRYEDQLHSLEQHVLHYEGTFNEPPEGFMLNNGQVTNFHIPIGDRLYQEAKWIQLNDDRTISGYTAMQGPNKQPYIIDLYTTPDYSIDSPVNSLPAWFQHMLTGPSGDFYVLQMMVAKTDDWGLVQEVTHYCEIDDNVTSLAVKIEEYQCNLDAA
jgi:hypothetical protein